MRSPNFEADGLPGRSRGAAGRGKFIGRVGALAVFLGVGAALAMPTARRQRRLVVGIIVIVILEFVLLEFVGGLHDGLVGSGLEHSGQGLGAEDPNRHQG